MKTRIVLGLTAVVAASLFTIAGHSADAQPNKVAAFMQLKLNHSQKLLEGIALEDFALIEKHAQALSTLSRDEMWQVYQTPEYLQYSAEFRRSADEVAAAAKKQNVDGAALAYVGMTLQCVHCHKHVRDVRMARAPGEELPFLLGGGH